MYLNDNAITTTGTFNSEMFNRYIDYTDVKETTLNGYIVCMRQFANWLHANDIQEPKREDIKAYKAYLEQQGYTAGTRSRYFRAVKHFFKWTAAEGLYPNIADNIKGAKVKIDNTKKQAFNEDDILTILNSIDVNSETGARDYAMILLAVTGGLRIVELQRADIGDIEIIKGQPVLYIQGKGRDEKDEYTKLPPAVMEVVTRYLDLRAEHRKTEPLFAGTGNRANGQRLTVPSISRIIKERFKAAGYDSAKLTAHSLRHTSNTILFKSGADLYKVQQHARHADPKTTEIYLHAVDREQDQSEQEIYNQIFNQGENDLKNDLAKLIQGMTAEEQIKLLEYAIKIKHEREIKIKH